MIVCSCNRITSHDVEHGHAELIRTGPGGASRPGAIHKCLGCRPRCGRCLPLIAEMVGGGTD